MQRTPLFLIDSKTIDITYIYDDYGTPVKVIKGDKSYFFHYNAQGDVVALTLASSDFYPAEGPYPGEVVASYKYDDWGNILESTGTVETPFGYRGKFGYVYDKETNLYFLKSRYYDPETGRFTTKDRFKGFENRPASQNQYTYCEGDPVNYVDPDGLWVWAVIGASIGGYAGYRIGKHYGLTGWKLVAAGAIGAMIGGVLGYAATPIISRLIIFIRKPPGLIGGVQIGAFKFMIHGRHHGKGIHIVAQTLRNGRWKRLFERTIWR